MAVDNLAASFSTGNAPRTNFVLRLISQTSEPTR